MPDIQSMRNCYPMFFTHCRLRSYIITRPSLFLYLFVRGISLSLSLSFSISICAGAGPQLWQLWCHSARALHNFPPSSVLKSCFVRLYWMYLMWMARSTFSRILTSTPQAITHTHSRMYKLRWIIRYTIYIWLLHSVNFLHEAHANILRKSFHTETFSGAFSPIFSKLSGIKKLCIYYVWSM